MEGYQESQGMHKCKYCGQVCRTGKSLGGHMRIHLALISAARLKKANGDGVISENFKNECIDNGMERKAKKRIPSSDNGSYDLRENPRKSWKECDSRETSLKGDEYSCNKCGKGFCTLRALTGHLRCHSIRADREQFCKTCGKEFNSPKALFGHMRSHSRTSIVSGGSVDMEALHPIQRKRSRIRYDITPSHSPDPNEMEMEAAIGLLMMSRGLGNSGVFFSVSESSDHGKSTSSEAQSPNRYRKTAHGQAFGREILDSQTESGGTAGKKINIEIKADELPLQDAEFEVMVKEKGTADAETEMVVVQEADLRSTENGFDVHDVELVDKSGDKLGGDILAFEDLKYSNSKRKKLLPRQGHGGRRRPHKIDGDNSGSCSVERKETVLVSAVKSKIEVENLIGSGSSQEEQMGMVEVTNSELARKKDHECPICFKAFTSGQALGGHKRTHYSGVPVERTKESSEVTTQELPSLHDFLDHNSSADLQKDDTDSVGLKPWWAGNDQGSEALVVTT